MSRPLPTLALLLLATILPATGADAGETTVTRDGIVVNYRDTADSLTQDVRDRILDTFFSAYLRERADFNRSAPAEIDIVIDPAYEGVAYVDRVQGRPTMTINPGWLALHPQDGDLVTHEAMHIVQSYPEYANENSPAWLVEGIADYARDRYGLDNAAGGWALPTRVESGHNFDSGYRVTAAFLKWSESRHPGLVKRLDTDLREGRYTSNAWRQATGKDVEALWDEYAGETGAAP